MSYQLTDSAQTDIRQISRHVRVVQRSPQNARLVAIRLKAHFKKLAAMPGIGHEHAEIDDPTARVSSVTGLLVIYDPIAKPLLVLRVIHPARDLRTINIRRK